jgi:hypothetical protein
MEFLRPNSAVKVRTDIDSGKVIQRRRIDASEG